MSVLAALSPIGWITLAFQGLNVAELAADGDEIGLVSALTGLFGLLFDTMLAASENW